MRRLTRALAIALAAAAALLPVPLAAGSGVPDDVVTGEILGGWNTKNGTRMAALRLTLAPGWKTYWRAPGDAGIPPSFDWSGSDNLRGVSYHWPSPTIFSSYGMRTVGYKDELVLPIELHPKVPGTPISLNGRIDLGVCETICMPARISVAAQLDGKGKSDSAIQAALASRPVSGARAGVESVTCDLSQISDGLHLAARITMPRLGGRETVLVETGDPRIWVSEPESDRKGRGLQVSADLVPPNGQPMALDRSAIRFTIIGDRQAVDIRGCAAN